MRARWANGMLFVSGGLALTALWLSVSVGRTDFGGICAWILAAGFLCYALLLRADRPVARVLCHIFEAAACLYFSGLLLVTVGVNVYARRIAPTSQTPQAHYLVIFGAGLRGEEPSRLLRLRIETAYTYLEEHPGTYAVLTGGLGEGETITEAQAIRRTLVRMGIADERLILEDRSRNTAQNGAYAMELIRAHAAQNADRTDASPELMRIVAVSNAFHLGRCVRSLVGAGANRESIYGLSAPLPNAGLAVSLHMREFASYTYYFFDRIISRFR